jgi:hypothetical protein
MSDGDRDVLPGARRLERIRDEFGAPVRSSPIGALALLGGAVGLWWGGTAASAVDLVARSLSSAGAVGTAINGSGIGGSGFDGVGGLREAVLALLRLAGPACVGAAAGAWLGSFVQGAGRWRPRRRGRLAGPTAAAAGGAAARALWAVVMMAAAAAAVALHAGRIAAMPAMPVRDGVQAAGALVLDAVLAALASGAIFAAVDVMLARWRWARAARMTPTEAREERRLEDGDPSLRARRRVSVRTMIAGSARRRDPRAEPA